MDDRIVVGTSAQEYFRELVAQALQGRRVEVSPEAEFYLVTLLSRGVGAGRETVGDAPAPEPLAMLLKSAVEADGEARWRGYKKLGDTSLFVSGFFGDSLSRSLVDVNYYIAMGERAYDALAALPRGPAGGAELFGELAERFSLFVDLFAEIAELSQLSSNRGVLRLYERFLLTGSERVAQRLRERGVALFAGPGRPKYGFRH